MEEEALCVELAALSDEIIGAQNGRQLLQSLEQRLGRLQALPAALYLCDPHAGMLYLAATLGEGKFPEEASLERLIDPVVGDLLLHQQGDPIGLLHVQSAAIAHPVVRRLAILLGPVLGAVQRVEQNLGELRQLHEQRRMLLTAGDLLRHLDLESLLVQILQTLLGAVQAHVGAVLLPDDAGQLAVRIAWGMQDSHVNSLRLHNGERLVDAVHRAAETCRLDHDQLAQQCDVAAFSGNVTGVLLVPIRSNQGGNGLVLLANPETVFDAALERLAETVCNMAAIALDNVRLVKATLDRERLHRELEIATKVQANIFPKQPLMGAAAHIVGQSLPCDETGGDYFTYFALGDTIYAVIADVTGHGLGAALYTTMAHAVIQQQLRGGVALDVTAEAVSDVLRESHSERFMTLVLLSINTQTKTFDYVSAGHNPLLWIHQGQATWLDSTSVPVGILPGMDFPKAGERAYAAGDLLLLYTDGITEAANLHEEQYGEERLKDLVLERLAAGDGPAEVQNAIQASVDHWLAGGPRRDDHTLLTIRLH